MTELCDCVDCKDSEEACSMDCEPGEECQGCKEAQQERAEIEFEIDSAQGRR